MLDAAKAASKNHGPIMVQQFFLNALNPPSGAIRVAQFQLVTSKCLAVTAFSGSLRNGQAAGGMDGNGRELISMRGRSSAG